MKQANEKINDLLSKRGVSYRKTCIWIINHRSVENKYAFCIDIR